ncbi:DUF4326 domain-containing protein [Mycobacterium colombiense]
MTTAPQRIQRRRTKGFIMPAAAVYVGRPTVFGNPWKVKHGLEVEGPGLYFLAGDGYHDVDTAHQAAVDLYREWLELGNDSHALKGLRLDETVADRDALERRRRRILGVLPALAGRDLSCWCPPGLACHGDVLIQIANQEAIA